MSSYDELVPDSMRPIRASSDRSFFFASSASLEMGEEVGRGRAVEVRLQLGEVLSINISTKTSKKGDQDLRINDLVVLEEG